MLCDGASEGYDGGGWARELSRCAVRFSSLQRAVHAARSSRFLKNYVLQDTDWSEILARTQGSYTTLLRVRILPRTVEVEGAGDTVVFFLREYELVEGFPAMEVGFFQQNPILISDRLNDVIPSFSSATIPWRKKGITSIVLATDSLAAFLLALDTEEKKKIFALFHRGTENRIWKALEEERARGRLGWDDLSFIWLELRKKEW